MLLGAPGIATWNKNLPGAPGLTTRSKAASSFFQRAVRNDWVADQRFGIATAIATATAAAAALSPHSSACLISLLSAAARVCPSKKLCGWRGGIQFQIQFQFQMAGWRDPVSVSDPVLVPIKWFKSKYYRGYHRSPG